MPRLFETTRINGLALKNRFVRSATYEAMAGLDGSVKESLLAWMADLVKGEVGLVITGHAHVALEGQAGPNHGDLFGCHDSRVDPACLGGS